MFYTCSNGQDYYYYLYKAALVANMLCAETICSTALT